MNLLHLPIDDVLPRVVELLRAHSSLVLKAPAGAGKTTRVPPAVLDAGIAGQERILLLQPRRLAARAAAARMAAECETVVGELIGYQVRFENRTSARTRIVSMTEGVFVRQLQDDPLLDGVSVVVFDEFHERSLDADVALAMVRRVQQELRPELKIVVMSATLAVEPIAAFLGNCPIVESAGRTFPVDLRYLRHARSEPVPAAAASAVRSLLDDVNGDLLVFLPGVGEIRRTAEMLGELADVEVMPLYADLPLERQQAVLAPSRKRKIVLATNVAETSITIEGITAVVDSGLARVNRLDANLGINRLELERISTASADQRAGRAGRTAPGVCQRLWTEREQHGLAPFAAPEIERVDLTGAVLELMCWGEHDVRSFPWYEAPPPAAVDRAESLLERLDAIAGGRVTDIGRRMVRLPVHPRLSRLLVAGQQFAVVEDAALLAAMLSERDAFRESQRDTRRQRASHRSDSDVLDRVEVLNELELRKGRIEGLDAGAAKAILRARDQLLRLLDTRGTKPTSRAAPAERDALLQTIFAAYPDRLARRRQPGSLRAVMLGGRGVKLIESSAVDAELFVCVELQELGGAEALIRQASAVRREWLPEDRLRATTEIEFDADRQRVVALRRVRFEDLVIEESPTAVPRDEQTAAMLAHEAAARLDLTTLLDDASRLFLARWQCLAEWMPELQLPALGEAPVRELLPQLCTGCISFEELRKAPALQLLKSQLPHHLLTAIDREAPEQLVAPSGSRIALAYERGKPPVLAVRIQELFGLKETPRIAGGRVPVLLHLLAPNYRPQQITTDLASFWKNTYSVVRGELRRRYPKHAWPEDPANATAERRPGNKRK
jgi:ATP-dependent helicase HrpB